MMRAQRVRDAENRIELQIAKWTAEGAVKSRGTPNAAEAILSFLSNMFSKGRVSCDVGHTSVAGDMLVSR